MLARFFLPQVLFYAAGAVLGAVLNTRGRFAVPMWAPVLNNLVVLASCGLFLLLPGRQPAARRDHHGAQVLVLGLGTTLGIVAQTVALLPSLRAAGFRFRLRTDLRELDLRRLAGLARWTLLYVVANQLAYLVVVNLAHVRRGRSTRPAAATPPTSTPSCSGSCPTPSSRSASSPRCCRG